MVNFPNINANRPTPPATPKTQNARNVQVTTLPQAVETKNDKKNTQDNFNEIRKQENVTNGNLEQISNIKPKSDFVSKMRGLKDRAIEVISQKDQIVLLENVLSKEKPIVPTLPKLQKEGIDSPKKQSLNTDLSTPPIKKSKRLSDHENNVPVFPTEQKFKRSSRIEKTDRLKNKELHGKPKINSTRTPKPPERKMSLKGNISKEYTLEKTVLEKIGTKGLNWSEHKKAGGNEALKDLRRDAILIPSAYKTALDVAEHMKEQGFKDVILNKVETTKSGEETGRDYKFSISYKDKEGIEREMSLRFFAPGSDTVTSDIDLSITVNPPNMFTTVWKMYDKNANQCLADLNEQIGTKTKTSQSLAKTFDLNLYSPGFTHNDTAKKSVFSSHTPEGIDNQQIADMGLGMVRTIEILSEQEPSQRKNEIDVVSGMSAKYQKSFDFALLTQLQNVKEQAKLMSELAEKNGIDPKKLERINILVNTNNYPDGIAVFDSGQRYPKHEREAIFSKISALKNAINDLSELEGGSKIIEDARKQKFLETHEEVESCIISKYDLQEELASLNPDNIKGNSVDDSLQGSQKLINEQIPLQKESDRVALKAHIAQGRGTMYADEAYNNAASIHKVVEGRQLKIEQHQSVSGAMSSIESDYGFILHHEHDSSEGFLMSTGKYLSRLMDQASTIDNFDNKSFEIGNKNVTGKDLKDWATKLEFIKNYVSSKSNDSLATEICKELDLESLNGVNKNDLCNNLTKKLLGIGMKENNSSILDVANKVRDFSRSSIK